MLARILCWLGIAVSLVLGIVFGINGLHYSRYILKGAFIGPLTIVLGSLLSWVGSFFIYGFGQLIEDADHIRNSIQRKD